MSTATETELFDAAAAPLMTRARWYTAARFGVLVLALLAWTAASYATELVPTIASTVSTLVSGFTAGWIYEHIASTMQAVVVGFLVAAALGYPTGYWLARNKLAGESFDPVIAAGFAVPRIIFFPVLLRIFGVGVNAEAALAAISAYFPIVVITTAAIRNVSPTLVKLGRSLDLSRLQLATKIYVPAAAPALMVGARIGFSISFIVVVVSEFFAAKRGLGLLAFRAYGLLQIPRMYATVFLIVIIALAGNLLLWWLEKRLRTSHN